jgi:hypothetical protein
LITVDFEREEQAREFEPLHWFGPEVTTQPGYQNRYFALNGLPTAPEVELTNAALDSLLNELEDRSASHQPLVEPAAPAMPPPTTDAEDGGSRR